LICECSISAGSKLRVAGWGKIGLVESPGKMIFLNVYLHMPKIMTYKAIMTSLKCCCLSL